MACSVVAAAATSDMSFVLAALGVILLALPHAFPRFVDLHRDSRWSVWGTGLGLRLIEVAAVLTAAPTFMRALGIHSMADACHRLSSPVPAGSFAGDIITALSIGMVARSVFVRIRLRARGRCTRIETTLGLHEAYLGHPHTELVTLPTTEWIAYATPGSPNQLVVSEGVRALLSDAELDALLSHEVAHLRLGHHRALRLLAELDGVAGRWARRFTDRVRLMLERTADEVACSTHGVAALHGALCVGGGPSSDPSMALRRDELGHSGPGGRVLPAALAVTAASAVLVVALFSVAAEHGLWGIVGLCGL